jgi:cell division initiation protein
MLTPQEVSDRAFSKASFGGYNMGQVDDFLDMLTGDYSALYSENAVLKSKLKVLVDKVEEYRSTEEAMRKALMTAQRMAEDLVKEAEQKKAEILQQAEQEAHQRLDELAQEERAEEYRLQTAQQATVTFVEQVRALHAKEEDLLTHLRELCPENMAPESSSIDDAASEIDDNVQRLLAQAMRDATAENLKAKQNSENPKVDLADTAEFSPVSTVDETTSDKQPKEKYAEDASDTQTGSRIDFSALQFGRDYEIR